MVEKLMDDNKLNFNRPLLSVRRGSSTGTLSEMDKEKPAKRFSDIGCSPRYKPDLKPGSMSSLATIPFKWEKIPGRAKDEQNPQVQPPEQSPKLTPESTVTNEEKPSKDVISSNTASIADDSGANEENGSSHSEGEDSTYLDALDTLSQSECCSMSGVSALHDPAVKSSGASLDPQSRDFMMVRFLPAAKAVASETPQFGSKKQLSVKEQQILIPDKQTPRFHSTPTSQEEYEDEEEDDGSDEYDRTENVSTKLCGLLPRFCASNQIPGMKGQPPTSMPSARKLPKKRTDPCLYDQFEKAIRDAMYERRRLTMYRRSEMRNVLNAEPGNQNLKSESSKSDELASSESDSIVPYIRLSPQSLTASKHSEANTIPSSPSLTVAKYHDSSARIHPLQLSMKQDIKTIMPLPLPKGPSESWLFHALPSVSSRRPLPKAYLRAKSLT